jgi:hypothetical protein
MSSTQPSNDNPIPTEITEKPSGRFGWKRVILVSMLVAGTIWGVRQWNVMQATRLRIVELEQEELEATRRKAVKPTLKASKPVHPLDPALEIARRSLLEIQKNVINYRATIVSRERSSGKLGEPKTMEVQVRNRKLVDTKVKVPFAVYVKFTQPKNVNGREVIWVEGANDGKMIAHEPGFRNILRIKLKPTSLLAMMGNRYPITEIGIEKLVAKLIQKGERDRQHGECTVEINDRTEVDGIPCTMIRVIHPEKREHFDFHIAEIYVDTKRQVPLQYRAYDWPEEAGADPLMTEEYIYRDLHLNVKLSDDVFDPDNPAYNYP